MNASEAAILLGLAAAYDRRTVGEADARAWADALDDIALEDAQDAVKRHYRTSTEWIMPAHVRKGVAAIARERRAELAAVRDPIPDRPEFPRPDQDEINERGRTRARQAITAALAARESGEAG